MKTETNPKIAGDIVYIVTGKTVHGKRFRIVTENFFHVMGINLFHGSVWKEESGKRQLLKRVRANFD